MWLTWVIVGLRGDCAYPAVVASAKGDKLVHAETHVNLVSSMELAGQNLVSALCPERDYLPYFNLVTDFNYRGEMVFSWPSHNIGRWWDALLRLEHTTGFRISSQAEAAMFANLKRFFDNPDGLCYEPRACMEFAPQPREDRLTLHSLREGLLALNGLVQYRNDDWARTAAHAMCEKLSSCINEDGTWNLDQLACAQVSKPSTFCDPVGNHGRFLEALVQYCQTTGDPLALRLADRIAAYHLKHSTRPDGSFNSDSVAGHTHSYLGTIKGLLLYGELTGQRIYIDRVAQTYRNTINGKILLRSGWNSHDLFTINHADLGSPGDAAQIALRLGLHHGCPDLLDDVERIVRARIIPSQITQCPPIEPMGLGESDKYRALVERATGGYGGCNHFPHAGKMAVTDVTAQALQSLTDIYNHVVTSAKDGLNVNFHFDYQDERVRISSSRKNATATVLIRPVVSGTIHVRIPRWVPKTSFVIKVNGKLVKATMAGDYAVVAAQSQPSEIVLTYDLPVYSEVERADGVDYNLLWRGDEVMGIYPNSSYFPFYPTWISAVAQTRLAFRARYNLAEESRGVAATASSQIDNGRVGPAINVLRDDESLWQSSLVPTPEDPQWLQLDLGAVHPLKMVVLDNRLGRFPANRFRLECSTEGKEFRPIEMVDDNYREINELAGIRSEQGRKEFGFRFEGVEGRYLRYVVLEQRWISTRCPATLNRLEVYDRIPPEW